MRPLETEEEEAGLRNVLWKMSFGHAERQIWERQENNDLEAGGPCATASAGLGWTGYLTPVSRADAATKHPCDPSGVTMSPWGLLVPSMSRIPVLALQVPSAWLRVCPRFPGCEICGVAGLKAPCPCCLSVAMGRWNEKGEASSQLQL